MIDFDFSILLVGKSPDCELEEKREIEAEGKILPDDVYNFIVVHVEVQDYYLWRKNG